MNFEILEVICVDCITPPNKIIVSPVRGQKVAVYKYQLSHVTVFP